MKIDIDVHSPDLGSALARMPALDFAKLRFSVEAVSRHREVFRVYGSRARRLEWDSESQYNDQTHYTVLTSVQAFDEHGQELPPLWQDRYEAFLAWLDDLPAEQRANVYENAARTEPFPTRVSELTDGGITAFVNFLEDNDDGPRNALSVDTVDYWTWAPEYLDIAGNH